MTGYVQLLKCCIVSVCITAIYLTFYAFSSTNVNISSNFRCKTVNTCEAIFRRGKSLNCSFVASSSVEGEQFLCSCDQKCKANSKKEESTFNSREQITRESISITHNPRDLTTRHINYFPPDGPSKKGLGALKLPDSLPWKSLELRLIYVLKVLHRSSRVVNVTHIINDLRMAIEIIEDIHTKLDLAYRSSDPIARPDSDEALPSSYSSIEKTSSLNLQNLTNGTTFKSPDMCHETYKGTLYGYPFYDTGWVSEDCTYQKPLGELVTIIFDFTKYPKSMLISSEMILMFSNIEKIYPTAKIIFAVQKGLVLKNKYISKVRLFNVSMVVFPSRIKPGKVLNKLISAVTTSYTYIAINIFSMDEDSRIERLVREISELNVSAVGSSRKDKNGIWSMNCYQMAYRNYTLTYRAGYHYSLHECVFCNFTEGPILARTNFLKEHKFDENLPGPLVFRDYFFKLNRLEHTLAVCPDSMQYVRGKSIPKRHEWLQLAKKWHLNKVILESDLTYEFSCEELRMGCNFITGNDASPFFEFTFPNT